MRVFKTKASIFAVLIIFAFFCGGALRKNAELKTAITKDIENPSSTYYAIVREVGGTIGIYLKDEAYPVKTLDIQVDSLPEADQRLLQSGIVVKNEDELISIIEDYTS